MARGVNFQPSPEGQDSAVVDITGIHEWIFKETPTGVRVETNESFAGEPVKADANAMQAMLDTSLSSWLGHLKMAAESVT